MVDYIRDLRPAKWGLLKNPEQCSSAWGLGCSLIPGLALALLATDAAVLGTYLVRAPWR
jgi:hypothetical protein